MEKRYGIPELLFVTGLVLFVSAIWINIGTPKCLTPPPRTSESDIDAVREAMRECLNRVPAHSFGEVQSPDGYLIQCSPIKGDN